MSPPFQSRSSQPPPNPSLRDLIAGKRRWTSSATQRKADAALGFPGWHERGYLPHRDSPGLVQFVTFRLADSFPATLRAEWGALLQIEDDMECRRKLEAYLDKGRGQCHLRQPAIGQLVEDVVRHDHGKNYDLRAWVIMPNHVHVLLALDKVPLGRTLKLIKQLTARQANRLLKRQGSFWAKDYRDTYIRDASHELSTCRYIENNPVKAGLVKRPADWPWSSARFRDAYGVLRL